MQSNENAGSLEDVNPRKRRRDGNGKSTDDDSGEEDGNMRASGVCDGCRKRKAKCDRNRPSCRPCRLRSMNCIYSARRKPGPRKGSTQVRTDHVQTRLDKLESLIKQVTPAISPTIAELDGREGWRISSGHRSLSPSSSYTMDTPVLTPDDTSPLDPNIIYLPPSYAPQKMANSGCDMITAELQDHLITLYFAHIQPVHPLFRKASFQQRLDRGDIPKNLLNAMFSLSARFSSRNEIMRPVNGEAWRAGDVFAQRAGLSRCHSGCFGGTVQKPSLEALQTAFLLSIFEATRFPDRQAWLITCTTVRLAYELCLDKVDPPLAASTSYSYPEDVCEEARYLWWAIWKLDTYFNIGSATPFNIEDDSNFTALLSTSVNDFTDSKVCPSNKIHLGQIGNIVSLVGKLALTDSGVHENMTILVNHLFREAATLRRLIMNNPNSKSLRDRRTGLENIMSEFTLALPSDYHSSARLGHETSTEHRQRLETFIQLHMASMYIYMPTPPCPGSPSSQADSTSARWHKCVHHADEIVHTLRDWPMGYFQVTDPMICFALWNIFLIYSLQMRISNSEAERCKFSIAFYLLRLVVENFAPCWGVARIILRSFDSLKSLSALNCDFPSIQNILLRYDGPLNQQTRSFVFKSSGSNEGEQGGAHGVEGRIFTPASSAVSTSSFAFAQLSDSQSDSSGSLFPHGIVTMSNSGRTGSADIRRPSFPSQNASVSSPNSQQQQSHQPRDRDRERQRDECMPTPSDIYWTGDLIFPPTQQSQNAAFHPQSSASQSQSSSKRPSIITSSPYRPQASNTQNMTATSMSTQYDPQQHRPPYLDLHQTQNLHQAQAQQRHTLNPNSMESRRVEMQIPGQVNTGNAGGARPPHGGASNPEEQLAQMHMGLMAGFKCDQDWAFENPLNGMGSGVEYDGGFGFGMGIGTDVGAGMAGMGVNWMGGSIV